MGDPTLAVIGARLGSARLPGKHLLDLAGAPMIAHIFARLDRVPSLDAVVLATTATPTDAPLRDWAVTAGRTCFAYEGDPDDLLGRVDAVVRAYQPARVAYICGDCPLIEPGIIEAMIRALRQAPGADLVSVPPREGRRVIHEGIDLYPIATWRKLVAAATEPYHREHVGTSLAEITEPLSTVAVEDQPIFYTLSHRISVDTPTDHAFMSEVYRRWYDRHPADEIVSLAWVIEQLTADPALRAINAAVKQKAVCERSVPVLIVTEAGPGIGLGHLRRMLALTRALQDDAAVGVRLAIVGEVPELDALAMIPHRGYSTLEDAIEVELERETAAVVCDVRPRQDDFPDLPDDIALVSIDRALGPGSGRHLEWIPSFYGAGDRVAPDLCFGWDCYLMEPVPSPRRERGNRILVLTGGSDAHGLGAVWPKALAEVLPPDARVTVVRGPFAPDPVLPDDDRLTLVESPTSMSELMARADYALTGYGVSLFECLAAGLPTVFVAPSRAPDDAELEALAETGAVIRASDAAAAVRALAGLMDDPERATGLATRAASLIDGRGPSRLTSRILDLVSELAPSGREG